MRRVAGLPRDLKAATGGKIFHGVHKPHAAVFHQEVDGRAAGAATEAVVKLFGLIYREGGRFFLVEGAKGLIILPRLAQGDIAVDEFHDVNPRQ